MARVEMFGVRHHSPAAARLIAERIAGDPPAVVLLEGPCDAQGALKELRRDHTPPLTLFTWNDDGTSAYYPMCEYSPEWVAIRAAYQCGVPAEFIDMPWSQLSQHGDTQRRDRFADPWLSKKTQQLLESRFGVSDLGDVIDELVEIPEVSYDDHRARLHTLGAFLHDDDAETSAREEHMARHIAHQVAKAKSDDVVLVVCGAAHVEAIKALLNETSGEVHAPMTGNTALVPTSYTALALDHGYHAGQRHPGFYEHVYRNPTGDLIDDILLRVTTDLREAGKHISVADLIAVRTTADGLAQLRGHARTWHTDLLDACTTCLVTEDGGETHPVIEQVRRTLRGDRIGELAPGTPIPPLAKELKHELTTRRLTPRSNPRQVTLSLHREHDLTSSYLLHSVVLLDIPGFTLERTTAVSETWTLRWHPTYESGLIMAAQHGSNRVEAVRARLRTMASHIASASTAAATMRVARQVGAVDLWPQLIEQLRGAIATTPHFSDISEAVSILVALDTIRLDENSHDAGADLGAMIEECLMRAISLAERGEWGPGATNDGIIAGLRTITLCLEQHTMQTCQQAWDAVLLHLIVKGTSLEVRGAALGAAWLTGARSDADIALGVRRLAEPRELGDFVAGVLVVAREAVFRRPDLLTELDVRLRGLSSEEFLTALPGLRRAFARYSPRERRRVESVVLPDSSAEVRRSTHSVSERVIARSIDAGVTHFMETYLGGAYGTCR